MTTWLSIWWILLHGLFGQQILLPLMSGPQPTGCTTPSGTTVTESFGDSSTLCWTSGPSNCNQTWKIGSGSIQSIISSPGTPPANTACANSMQMTTSGSNDFIYKDGFGILSSSNYDVRGTIYVSSGISLGNAVTILCWVQNASTDCDLSNAIVSIRLGNPSGTSQLWGMGSDQGMGINITLSAWHTFVLHHDSTAANCYLAVDGGAHDAFTCNAPISAAAVYAGPQHYGAVSSTWVLGNLAF